MIKQTSLAALFVLSQAGLLYSSNTATQTVTFSIAPICEMCVSGDPPPLNASSTSPGYDPIDVVDNSTYYMVTTNGSSQTLTASLSSVMPAGTYLNLIGDAPTGATSVGSVYLDTTDQVLVTGISQIAQSNLMLTYVFQSTTVAGTLSPTSRIVTFTLNP
jgi:hypothetical protein